jgi:uncharacterized phage protein (TIGR01671 family)
MNRKIKFRVWDNQNNDWLINQRIEDYPVELLYSDHKFYIAHSLSNLDNYVIQQFTGLLDKNGIDIYEGDVVTYTSNNGIDYKAPIVFSPTSSAFVLDTSGRHLFDDKYGDYLDLHKDREYEIVGNIFENSELLK